MVPESQHHSDDFEGNNRDTLIIDQSTSSPLSQTYINVPKCQ